MYDGTTLGGIDSLLADPPSKINNEKNNSLRQPRQLWNEFIIESSEEERRILNFGISSSITESVFDGRAVYLERLGIVFPSTRNRKRSTLEDRTFDLISETVVAPEFEKCSELISYQRDRFKGIVDTKDLISIVKGKIAFFVKWKDKKIDRYIRGFLALLRYEVIVYGYSERLSQLGIFYAVHNRQGKNDSEWIDGADIFLRTDLEIVLESGRVGRYTRPVLASAWEPFEAQYGKPISYISLNIKEELRELGIEENEISKILTNQQSPLEISVFKCTTESDDKLVFVTNGLRKLGIKSHGIGTELVFQIVPNRLTELGDIDFKNFSARSFALAWMLLVSGKDPAAPLGEGLSSDISLIKESANIGLTSILLTTFRMIESEQLTNEGKFNYICMTLLYSDEAKVIEDLGSTKIIALLERRGLDQVNRETRGSLFGKKGKLKPSSLSLANVD